MDGPGFRTSIYFAGCSHECPGCHNPASWDFSAGTPYSLDEIVEIVEEEDFDVTLSGGDPLYHPQFTALLIEAIKLRNHKVWVYTGFTWEEIMASETLSNAIKDAQVVVDSPFKMELRDTDLLFRGSSNQRLVDVAKSLSGTLTEWIREE